MDKTFVLENNKETRQQVLKGLGDQHIEIICSKLKNKFCVDNDVLRVNAIAVEQGETKAIIISADIVSIGTDLVNKICILVSKETGISAENI